MMETHSHGVVLLSDEAAEESASARRRRERGIMFNNYWKRCHLNFCSTWNDLQVNVNSFKIHVLDDPHPLSVTIL